MGISFYITEDQEDRRIDRLLRTRWPQLPLGAIMKAIRTGEVRLDSKKVKPDTRLKAGQFLQLPWDDEAVQHKTVQNADAAKKYPPLPTIYKDENVWIINKPAGLLTQPDAKGADSVFSRVLSELNWTRTDFHPSTVQRLDRNTSGIILVALSGKFQRLLTELIRERQISKIYRAVVYGNISENGRIDFPLLKDGDTNTVRIDQNGAEALTLFEKLSGCAEYSCAEIQLVTGRSHQIRVHFAAIGHPLLGDRKYGNGKGNATRTLLHAYEVKFPYDSRLGKISGRSFTAALPSDMLKYFA